LTCGGFGRRFSAGPRTGADLRLEFQGWKIEKVVIGVTAAEGEPARIQRYLLGSVRQQKHLYR
jgi:hypothetical protein